MASSAPDRLDGWKAIADYLGRNVRTVQRWRDERGMPVYRVPGSKGATVFAYPMELDAWLREAASERNAEPAAVVATEPANDQFAPADPPASNGWRRSTRWLAGAAALAISTLIVGTLGFSWYAPTVDRAELRGGNLVALDGEGRTIWSFTFPDGSAEAPSNADRVFPLVREAWPVDLDGDGEREVVAFLDYYKQPDRTSSSFERGEVYSFSSRGALSWRFTPELTLSQDGRTFTGPWGIRDTLIAGNPARVWVSFIHQTWWPSFVVMLDAAGRSSLKFVNGGHIQSLSRVATPSGTYILAGGTNNEYGAASLAVLEEQGPSASSPSGATSSLTCDACPSRGPAKYLLFPRSELNIASDWPRNFVYLFTPNEAGAVDVSVQEHSPPPLRAVYELSADLTPKSVAMSDAYWEAHRRLSAEGKLNHTPEECPERKRGMSVRSWDAQSGWKEFLVPHMSSPDAAGRLSTEQQDRRNVAVAR